MISILILGKGKVGTHLFEALKNKENLQVFFHNSRVLKDLPKVDITIITVSDDAIAEVSEKLDLPFVVHTSGSLPVSELKNKSRKGVFYMLQSFSKEKEVDFSKVPFCIEAQNTKDLNTLKKIAETLSENIYEIDSKQRQYLHVAAVFANNFTNHMFSIAESICLTNEIPFPILYPLIQETAKKIQILKPKEAQTGPAVRNDKKTIKNHLNLLEEKQKEIYKILTNSIQNGN